MEHLAQTYFESFRAERSVEVAFGDYDAFDALRKALSAWKAEPANRHEAVFETAGLDCYEYQVRQVPRTKSGYQDAKPYSTSNLVAERSPKA